MLRQVMRVLLVGIVVFGWSGNLVHSQAETFAADAPVGNAITYQGWLQHNGAVVDGVCDLRFALFDTANNANQIGNTLTRANQTVSGGYFTVNDLNFGVAFTGEARWLEVAVRCPAGSGDFTTLTPRQPLTPAPYALHAMNNWALHGNAGTTANHFVGTRDAMTLTLKVSDTVALRLLPNATSPNIIGGIEANSVTPGVSGATIGGGGALNQGIAFANRITDDYGVISGGSNNQAGDNTGTPGDQPYTTVGGGENNVARAGYSTISGGKANGAIALYATVGGGVENNALADGATVAGGAENTANGAYATVGGGIENSASAGNATIAGGTGNNATGLFATIGGGSSNQAVDEATVAGGANNQASELGAVVGGGSINHALGQYSTIAGGTFNQAQDNYATVSGGHQNQASGEEATVAGGVENQATSGQSTVSGGSNNIASGGDATVAGGTFNEASGTAATISGGTLNRASGNYATVAGGADAQASHYGEWAYAAGGFANDLSGEAQTSIYILRGTTTSSGAITLSLDGSSEQITIAPGRTVVFDIQIAARSTDGDSGGYHGEGVIMNHSGLTYIVGGNFQITSIEEHVAAWTVNVVADDVGDSLKVTVNGSNGDNVRWVATVRTTEVQN